MRVGRFGVAIEVRSCAGLCHKGAVGAAWRGSREGRVVGDGVQVSGEGRGRGAVHGCQRVTPIPMVVFAPVPQ